MPQVVYEKVMTLRQPLPAGGRIESVTFDVNGARAVSIMLSIVSSDPNVHWTILFGPTQNNAFSRTVRGTFGDNDGGIAIQIPVFAPNMVVEVENRGTRDTSCDGNLYFIRDVP